MIDRKQLILVTIPGQTSVLFDRSDWSEVVHSESGPIDPLGIVELELSSGQRAGCYGELSENWDWEELTDYLQQRFAIPSGWTASGEAMIMAYGEKRTVEATTYDTPEGDRAIDILGNHYLAVCAGGEPGFVHIPNCNLTNAAT